MIAVVVMLALLAVVAVVVGVALVGRGGRGGVGRAEAERLASLEAERLLGERYRAGEIGLEEFERDLAALLARRDRVERRGD